MTCLHNTTKCFAQMEKKGLIELSQTSSDDRKIWSITEEGGKAFLNEIKTAEIFTDSLYTRNKKAVVALATKIA